MAEAAVITAGDSRVAEVPKSAPTLDGQSAQREVGNTAENAAQNRSILSSIESGIAAAGSAVLHKIEIVGSAVGNAFTPKENGTPGLETHQKNLEQRNDGTIVQTAGDGTRIETLRDSKTNETTQTRKDLKGNTESETTGADGKVLNRTSFHLNDDQSRTYRTEDLRSGNPVVDTIQMDSNTLITSHTTDTYDQDGKHTTIKDGDGNTVYRRETETDGTYMELTTDPKTNKTVTGEGRDAAPIAPSQEPSLPGLIPRFHFQTPAETPTVMPKLEMKSDGSWSQTKLDGTTVDTTKDKLTGETTVITDTHRGNSLTEITNDKGKLVFREFSNLNPNDMSTTTTSVNFPEFGEPTANTVVKNAQGRDICDRDELFPQPRR